MSHEQTGDTWLDTSEYCEIRHIPKESACRERREGRGPPFFQDRPRGAVMYRAADVAAYMRDNTIDPAAS